MYLENWYVKLWFKYKSLLPVHFFIPTLWFKMVQIAELFRLHANAKRWSLSSKLWRYRFRWKQARFDGNLNNGNPIVARTYSLAESQSQSHACIVHVTSLHVRACHAFGKLNLWPLSAGFIAGNEKRDISITKKGLDWYWTEHFSKIVTDFTWNLSWNIEEFKIACYYLSKNLFSLNVKSSVFAVWNWYRRNIYSEKSQIKQFDKINDELDKCNHVLKSGHDSKKSAAKYLSPIFNCAYLCMYALSIRCV